MPLFWNVSFEHDKASSSPKCPVCSSLSLLHDESLCSFFWHFSISIVDIASGFHGIPSSNFPSKYSSDKINFFTATWTKVAERPFFLPDDVLGTIKKKKKALCLHFGENTTKVCENIVFVKEMNVRCSVYQRYCAAMHSFTRYFTQEFL